MDIGELVTPNNSQPTIKTEVVPRTEYTPTTKIDKLAVAGAVILGTGLATYGVWEGIDHLAKEAPNVIEGLRDTTLYQAVLHNISKATADRIPEYLRDRGPAELTMGAVMSVHGLAYAYYSIMNFFTSKR